MANPGTRMSRHSRHSVSCGKRDALSSAAPVRFACVSIESSSWIRSTIPTLSCHRRGTSQARCWLHIATTLARGSLQIQVERQGSRVEVDALTAVAVSAREATMRSLLGVEVSNAPIAAIGLRLPAALRVAQVRVPSGADWFIDRQADCQRLTVNLERTVGRPNGSGRQRFAGARCQTVRYMPCRASRLTMSTPSAGNWRSTSRTIWRRSW